MYVKANIYLVLLVFIWEICIMSDPGMERAMDRRQMTLMLSDKEMTLLGELADRRGMTKTALLRQAMRMYQSVIQRIENGEKVFVEDPATKDKTELMVL